MCTPQTAALAAIVLRDSAHLQEEDADYANRAGFSRHRPALPLYGEADVDRTLPLLEPLEYDRTRSLCHGLSVTLRPSGHILGSSTAQVTADETETLFSGDLGRPHHPLLQPPADPPEVHTIVVESTYGDRSHPQPDDELLASAVRRTAARGGSVLVPAFAVDRTELVLLELHRLLVAGRIPRLPIYVDSPMALESLEIYRRAAREHQGRLRRGVAADVFDLPEVHAVHDAAGSERLNQPSYPCIIVSASGRPAAAWSTISATSFLTRATPSC